MSSGPSYHSSTHRPETLGGTDPLQPYGFYEIAVFGQDETLEAGDNAFSFPIPHDLDGTRLVYAAAGVTVDGSGTQVMIHNCGQDPTGSGSDMLSTVITIDPNEWASDPYATTQPVINQSTNDVAVGDWVRIDVDTAGGAQGLRVMLAFGIV